MKLHRLEARVRPVFCIIALFLCILMAACGGGAADAPADNGSASESAEEADTESGVPTMPAANFAQPTTQIGSASGASEAVTDTETLTQTTEMTDSVPSESEAAETPEPAADDDAADSAGAAPVDDEQLTRGANAYSRQCAECHGDDATGVDGQGSALVGLALTESELNSLLRTGGDLGPEHLFGPQKISPGSLEALYLYLQTLAAE